MEGNVKIPFLPIFLRISKYNWGWERFLYLSQIIWSEIKLRRKKEEMGVLPYIY